MIYKKDSKVISSKNISIGQRVELNPFNSTLDLQKKAQDFEKHLLQMESQHSQILEELEVKKNKILEDTKSMSEQIEREAYERGYNQGQANGYEDGYKEAYNENLEKAKLEGEAIIKEATNVLLESKSLMESYIKENRRNIIEFAISIAEQVLKERFEETDSMNNMIEDVISQYGVKKSIVIKVNPLYKEELDNVIDLFKKRENINDDIFILAHEGIEKGNVIIETDKGSVYSGMDIILDSLKEELR